MFVVKMHRLPYNVPSIGTTTMLSANGRNPADFKLQRIAEATRQSYRAAFAPGAQLTMSSRRYLPLSKIWLNP